MRLNIALKNVLVLAMFVGASSAQAAVCTWLGATTGGWFDDANWSCGSGPTTSDDLVFPNSAPNKSHVHNRPLLPQVNSITINGCGYNITGASPLNITSSTPILVSCDTLGATNAINITGLVFTSAVPIQVQHQTSLVAAGNVTLDLGLTNGVQWNGSLEFRQTQPGMTQPIIRVKLNELNAAPTNEIVVHGGRTVFPSANVYSGLTSVVLGQLEVLDSAGLGASGTAATGTIVRSNAILTKGNVSIAGELLTLDDNLNAAGVPDPLLFASGAGNWGGAIALSGPVNGALRPAGGFASDASISWSVSGVISGAADIEIAAKGTGAAFSLAGANSYTGATRIINFGRLNIGAQSERIPNTSVVDIATGGTLAFLPQIVSATETIGGLSGLGSIGFGDAQPAPRLFISVASGRTHDFGGTITDLNSGSIPVEITGAGTQTISGSVTTAAPFNVRNNAIFNVRGTLFPTVNLDNNAELRTGPVGKVFAVQPVAATITGARIQPGGPGGGIGILEISGGAGAFVLHPNLSMEFDLSGNIPGVTHDQVKSVGGLTVDLNSAPLSVSIKSNLIRGQSATLIDADAINGTFSGYPEGSLYPTGPPLVKYVVSYAGGDFTLTRPTLVTLSAGALSGTIGQVFSAPALAPTGGVTPYSLSISGEPAWLMGTQDGNTFPLTGTVAGPAGVQNFTLRVADAAGQVANFPLAITVINGAPGDYSWTGSVDSDWSSPMNWSPAGPPSPGSIVRFLSGPSITNVTNVPTISLDFVEITDGYSLSGSGLLTLANANPIRFNGATSSATTITVPMFLSAPNALVSATTVDPANSVLRLGTGNGTLDFAGNIKFELANSLPGDTGFGYVVLEPYLKDTTASTGIVTYERVNGSTAHQVRLSNNTAYSGDTIVNGPRLEIDIYDLTAPFGNSGGVTQTVVNGAQVIINSTSGDFIIPNERLTLNVFMTFASVLASRAASFSAVQTWMGEIVVPAFATIRSFGGKLRLANAVTGGGAVDFDGDNAIVLVAACSVGNLTIKSGATLEVANSDLIPNTSTVTLENNARFDLNGNQETIAALSGVSTKSIVDVTGNMSSIGRLTTTGTGSYAGQIVGSPFAPAIDGVFLGGGYRIVSGTQTLLGSSTFSEPAEVLGGTLVLQGSLRNAVIDGGTLRVSGSGSAVNSLASANTGSTGTLDLRANLDVATTALINSPITVSSSADSDSSGRLTVVENVDISGSSLLLVATPTPGLGYDLIDITGSGLLTGVFNGLPDNSIIASGGFNFRINYTSKKATITRILPPIVVTTASDPGNASNCSLRKALEAVALGATPINSNCPAGTAGATITFDPGVFSSPQTITLTGSKHISIQTSVIIIGPGARLLSIDAINNSRVFAIDDALPSNYANVEIYGLNLVKGLAVTPTAFGGAIASEENLILGGVRIAQSEARYTDSPPGLANGGAIAMGVEANLTIYDSLLVSNQAVTAATDSFAKGGAIYMDGGSLSVENSTLTNNIAAVTGTASGPAAPAAAGGAIYLKENGTANISSSTLVDNKSRAQNPSVATGEFESRGGGIVLNGSTFADTLTIKHSVLKNQSETTGLARTVAPDIFYNGGTASADYSYIASATPSVTITNAVIGAPLLAALANNGGETDTISFAFGSSLIDAGDPVVTGLPPFDQRGPGFPRIFGSRVDIGAFELNSAPLPNLSISSASVAGDTATKPSLNFVVTLSAVSAVDVIFIVNTSTMDAEASDFTAISNQTVIIPMGMTTATVSVAVTPDTIVEATETVLLTLSTPIGANISAASGTGTIGNDDQAVISVSSASSALESANATITISSSNVIEGLATVNFAAFDGTDPNPFQNAASNVDFVSTPGSATISSGSVTGVVTVTEDTLVEAPEQFRVILSSVAPPVGIDPMAISIAPAANTHVHTILNNDVTNAATTAATIIEGNSGAAQLNFTVTLSVPAAAPIQVLVSTANFGSNPADAADYSSFSNLVVSFAPGVTSRMFSVEIVSDDIVEANETLQVLLTDPAFPIATIITAAVTGTINNDDSAILSIGSTSVTEGNVGSTPMNFLMNLSQPVQGTVSVSFTPMNGTATAPGDFNATPSTVNFPSLGLNAGRSVSIVADTVFEPDETLSIVLGALTLPPGVTGVSLNSASATGTILNDDIAGGTSTIVLSAPLPTLPFTAGITYPVSFTVSAATRPSGSAIVSATRQGTPELPPISCSPTLTNGSNANELVGSCNLSPTAPGVWVTSVFFTGSGGFTNVSVSGNAVFTTALAPLTFTQSLNPTVVGQAFSVTISASATSGGPTPSGSVLVTQFPGGITTSAALVSGSATVNLFSRSPVVKGLLVAYTDPSGVYLPQEQFIEHTTNPANTAMSASLSAAQGGANQPVTVTYTLGVLAPGAIPPGLPGPSGQIQVSDGVTSAICTLTFPTGSCTFSPSTLGARQITARYLSDASYQSSTSAPLPYTVQQGGGSVDLVASIGNGVRVINGAQVIYTIEVRNIGDATVGSASITNALPAGALSQTYSCIAAAGSSCGASSGTGGIAQMIDVAPSGSVAYQVVVELPVAGETVVSNTVTVEVPAGVVDANPANNSATDTDPRGIFGAGFEDDVE